MLLLVDHGKVCGSDPAIGTRSHRYRSRIYHVLKDLDHEVADRRSVRCGEYSWKFLPTVPTVQIGYGAGTNRVLRIVSHTSRINDPPLKIKPVPLHMYDRKRRTRGGKHSGAVLRQIMGFHFLSPNICHLTDRLITIYSRLFEIIYRRYLT